MFVIFTPDLLLSVYFDVDNYVITACHLCETWTEDSGFFYFHKHTEANYGFGFYIIVTNMQKNMSEPK